MGELVRKAYVFLTSAKLAIALLVAILASCVVGVTVVRGGQAWSLIFSTAWFNSLLVLLVLNVSFCFFGRIFRRKLTLVSFGMILFHLSFVAIFIGIIYNSMFFFHGEMRLSEGEVLSNSDLNSYDVINHGRFFKYSRLKGETTLNRMHWGYKVGGEEKVAAYDISVGEGGSRKRKTIYITKNLNYDGFRYFPDREGYSILVMLHDKKGRELYGGVIPLQSLKREDGTYLYTTGTKFAPGSFPFPYPPATPVFFLQASYYPSKFEERKGSAQFRVWPFHSSGAEDEEDPLAEGSANIGELFRVGDYQLSLKEVRYWVGMDVRYDPGLTLILSSLWMGLTGMIITFFGRLRLRRSRQKASQDKEGEGH